MRISRDKTTFRLIVLACGVCACSTSVIFIKDSKVPPMFLASYRLLLSSVLLAPLFFADMRKHPIPNKMALIRRCIAPGGILGLHLITWITGARMTLAANASLIVNLVPLVMPLLFFLMVRERLTRREWIGTLVAGGGVLFLAGVDFRIDSGRFMGDLICFASMLLFALYLAFSRRNKDFPTLWLYVVPVYFFAGIISLCLALPFDPPWAGDYPRDLLMILGLALLPTIIGHSIYNYSMRYLRGQVVSIATLGESIFAGAMAYLHPNLREAPHWNYAVACVLIAIGAGVALRGSSPGGTRE